jgi:tripartite-type tricarboxylate transporter receptor subunit TctC
MLALTTRAMAVCCTAFACISSAHAAQADPAANYPTKPIRFVVPFAPGAGTDTTARTIAQKLGEKWGHQAVVENRTGAGGTIGVEVTAKASPDGYTICLISASNSVNAATNPALPYDLTKDLQGIAQASSLFYVVYIHPAVPAKSIKELIAHAKANPGKLNFGSAGMGNAAHLAAELFAKAAGIQMVHVPYKGNALAMNDLVAGNIQVLFDPPQTTLPQVAAGRIRSLGVTSRKRFPGLPDVPTIAEAGYPSYEFSIWYAMIAPAGVPAPVVARWNAEINKVVGDPAIRQRFAATGSNLYESTPAECNALAQKEFAQWAQVFADLGIKPE